MRKMEMFVVIAIFCVGCYVQPATQQTNQPSSNTNNNSNNNTGKDVVSSTGCTVSSDCPLSMHCEDGVCKSAVVTEEPDTSTQQPDTSAQQPDVTVVECSENAHCDDGLSCVKGQCVANSVPDVQEADVVDDTNEPEDTVTDVVTSGCPEGWAPLNDVCFPIPDTTGADVYSEPKDTAEPPKDTAAQCLPGFVPQSDGSCKDPCPIGFHLDGASCVPELKPDTNQAPDAQTSVPDVQTSTPDIQADEVGIPPDIQETKDVQTSAPDIQPDEVGTTVPDVANDTYVNPCESVVCNDFPADECIGNKIAHYISGSCSQGVCGYGFDMNMVTCDFGCDKATGKCLPSPCTGVVCDAAHFLVPDPTCFVGTPDYLETYAFTGKCLVEAGEAACETDIAKKDCPFGCEGGICYTSQALNHLYCKITCQVPEVVLWIGSSDWAMVASGEEFEIVIAQMCVWGETRIEFNAKNGNNWPSGAWKQCTVACRLDNQNLKQGTDYLVEEIKAGTATKGGLRFLDGDVACP
jgi:hypothetical protein